MNQDKLEEAIEIIMKNLGYEWVQNSSIRSDGWYLIENK
jgi:hypothetical protein